MIVGSQNPTIELARGLHSMLELDIMCMHDHEINTLNIQDVPPRKNDLCTNVWLKIPSNTYTSNK